MQKEMFQNGEDAIFRLRNLYESYGYSQFKMLKFEEYDLYVKNKDFLISDEIITFTDTNGKLMALKPDVTLSIIKNFKPDLLGVQKVYYNENVYRVSGETKSFKEIMQLGIECMGQVDEYCLFEVLLLAAKSLKALSRDAVLDLSHFGLVTDLIDSLGVDSTVKQQLLELLGEKNAHAIRALCKREGVSDEKASLLDLLVSTYGEPSAVFPVLKKRFVTSDAMEKISQLERLCLRLSEAGYADILRVDFSEVCNANFYNGIVFRGFLKGISTWILSGGQYDRLMQKMNRSAAAVGFGVYLDLLEELQGEKAEFDVDVLLLYDSADRIEDVYRAFSELSQTHQSVLVQNKIPDKLRYQRLYRVTEQGAKIV